MLLPSLLCAAADAAVPEVASFRGVATFRGVAAVPGVATFRGVAAVPVVADFPGVVAVPDVAAAVPGFCYCPWCCCFP